MNIATMCYIPIQCNFVCMCLRDMHSCKLTGDVAAVSTITQLSVFATLHLIRKLHPALKNESKQMDAEAIFNKVGDSLKKHVKVAKCCTLSSPHGGWGGVRKIIRSMMIYQQSMEWPHWEGILRKTTYKVLVQPTLEYATCTWSPHIQGTRPTNTKMCYLRLVTPHTRYSSNQH